jgi:hypothetical protein
MSQNLKSEGKRRKILKKLKNLRKETKRKRNDPYHFNINKLFES